MSDWEAMAYRYISEVVDGDRMLLRMPPGSVRKTEYRRKAPAPGAHGQPRWGFPTTWLMGRHTGYRKSIAIPKMEDRIFISAWKAAMRQPANPLRAAGGGPNSPRRQKTSSCPAGIPSDRAKYNAPGGATPIH